jgi:WD40 repeat protein
MRFGDARLRHMARVESLALNADGSRLLTATRAEPVLRLWDVKTGRLLRRVRVAEEFTESMTVLALTPDARRAFVIRHQWRQRESKNRWHEPATIDLATGAITKRWPLGLATTGPPHIYALAPDGKTLAGLVGPDAVRVWDFESGAERMLGRFAHGDEHTGAICFSPDGTQIAAYRGRGTSVVGGEFLIGPVSGKTPLRSVPVKCDPGGVTDILWLEPNRVVALSGPGPVAFDPATGAEIEPSDRSEKGARSFPTQPPGGTSFVKEFYLARPAERYRFAVAQNGKVCATASHHAVRLFDPRTGTPLHPDLERSPSDPQARLYVSPDGAVLLGCTDYNAYARSLSDGRALGEFEGRARRTEARFALSPDGRFVGVGLSSEWDPQVVEVRTGRRVPLSRDKDGFEDEVVGFAGNGRAWLWDADANTFTPVEIGTNRAGTAVPGFTSAEFVAVAADGRKMAASGSKGLALRALDADRGWVVLDSYKERINAARFGTKWGIPVRFSPCGGWLLVSDSGLELWDVRKTPVRVGRFGTDAPLQWWADGAFSPDGRFLAAAVRARDGETELCVWETASAAEVYRFRPARGVAGCAFTPDGRRLVIAHNDTTLGVWDRSGVEARHLGAVPAGTEWQHLRNRDATRAHAAVRALVANPDRALALLTPAYAPPDVALTDRLITELGAEEFRVREGAERALAELGLRAESALSAAVARSEVPEVQARAAALLKALGPGAGRLTGERLRAVRSVEVLERIASPEAKALLATWATHPDGTLAAEARTALTRLGKSEK